MRRINITAVVLAALGFLLYAPGARAQGISATKHNLSTSGTGSIHLVPGGQTGEICVFCHTPHGADTTVAAPLWNRAQTQANFSMYTSPTLDAIPDARPTGTSLACLSCHDGTVALDAIRNMPGSGGFTDSTTVASRGWTFVAGSTAAGNLMPTNSVANLGTNLTNDHPISMIYANARSPSSTSASETAGFDVVTVDGTKKCVGPDANCTSGNNLPLSSATIGGPADYVQCTSCHDPHRSNTLTFLRKSNDGSALCLTCHLKNS